MLHRHVPQAQRVPIETPPFQFQTPSKRIQSPEDIRRFHESFSGKNFLGFIVALSESVRGRKISDPVHHQSPITDSIVSILETLIQWVDEIPPTQMKSRYGNVSYRVWQERLVENSENLMLRFLPDDLRSSTVEIVPYFTDSFGNSSRIDYGTGHETNFAAWLYCLARLGLIKEEDYDSVVIRIFVKYMALMRKLQTVYCLEPAGSHGVWGLDDYHFLPYIFGSSQLINHKYMKPKSIHNEDILENFSHEYLYLSCIAFVKKVKKGPFSEHSPLLDDISGVPNWNKVNSGLLKMYKVEVLEKVPIMQHFIFGSLIKCVNDGGIISSMSWRGFNGSSEQVLSLVGVCNEDDHHGNDNESCFVIEQIMLKVKEVDHFLIVKDLNLGMISNVMFTRLEDQWASLELEEEEEIGLVAPRVEQEELVIDTRWCLIGKLLLGRVSDFDAFQNMMAFLWQSGKGMYVKKLNSNLFLFQFYHEIDIERVITGSPWTFNKKQLILHRLKEGENPRNVNLHFLDLWIHIYDLEHGFQSLKVVTDIGNLMGKFVESDINNFSALWREYMRIRVTIDVEKLLRRRMKIFREDRSWFWANFKYENLSTFCFICGILGHSEHFCPKLFHTPSHLIQKPYGMFLKANSRRTSEKIRAKWLRSGAVGGISERGEGSLKPVTPVMAGVGQAAVTEELIEGFGDRGLATNLGEGGVIARDLREKLVEGNINGAEEDIHVNNNNDFIVYSDSKRKGLGCGLVDLSLEGYPFTWEKGKGSSHWVEERLDKALVSHSWLQLFPLEKLYNVEISTSDHCPILLTPEAYSSGLHNRSFHFENTWLREPMCKEVVRSSWEVMSGSGLVDKIQSCGEALEAWGKEFTGNFKDRISQCKMVIRRLKKRRDEDSVKLHKEKQEELFEILTQREIYWKQRSKQFWLCSGDTNKNIFIALLARGRGKITFSDSNEKMGCEWTGRQG
uniref:peptidylprolyl isomerase n=1 Tax=Cannabis sativa TaxID=3483 RepID=A0A803NM17_CANSA